MKKILRDLRNGCIPGWDSHLCLYSETPELNKEIMKKRQYFASNLSVEDFERFEALEALHKESHAVRYRKTYANAFKLGVMLMCAVFMDGDDGQEDGK